MRLSSPPPSYIIQAPQRDGSLTNKVVVEGSEKFAKFLIRVGEHDDESTKSKKELLIRIFEQFQAGEITKKEALSQIVQVSEKLPAWLKKIIEVASK